MDSQSNFLQVCTECFPACHNAAFTTPEIPEERALISLTPVAASGIVGYPLKGIDAELSKVLKGDSMKEVRKQRNLQGEMEFFEAGFTNEQVEEIGARWEEIIEGFGR